MLKSIRYENATGRKKVFGAYRVRGQGVNDSGREPSEKKTGGRKHVKSPRKPTPRRKEDSKEIVRLSCKTIMKKGEKKRTRAQESRPRVPCQPVRRGSLGILDF